MSADPTTLMGTLVSLEIAKHDKKAREEEEAEEARREKESQEKEVVSTGYTDFSDWDKVDRPRAASLQDFGNNYLSALAISGEDYLRYQAKLNPNTPFIKPGQITQN